MNRIFKLKFNKTNSELVVCSELATSADATTEQQATPAKFLSNLKLAMTGVALIAASVASVQANGNVVPVSVEAVKQSVTVLDSLHDAIGEQAEKVKATLVKPFAEPEPQPANDLASMGDVLDAMSRDFSDLKAAIQDKVEFPQEVKEQLAQDTAKVEAPAEKPVAPEAPEQPVVKDFDLGGFADSVASLTKDIEGKVTLPQEVKEQLAQDTAKVESPAEKPVAPEASAPADAKEFDNDAFASDVADLAKKLADTLPLVQEVKAEIAKDTANTEAVEQPAPAQPTEKDTVAEVVKQLPELHDTVGELANKLADTFPLVKEVQEVIAAETANAEAPAQPDPAQPAQEDKVPQAVKQLPELHDTIGELANKLADTFPLVKEVQEVIAAETANAEAPAQPTPAQPEAKEFDSDAFSADVSNLAKKLAGTLPLTQEVKAEIAKETANAQAPEQPAPAQPAQEDKVAQAVKQLPELHDTIGELANKLADTFPLVKEVQEVIAAQTANAEAPTQPAPAQPEAKEFDSDVFAADVSDLAQKLAGTFPLTQEVKAEIAKETANAQAPEQPASAQPEAKEFDSDAFAADVSDLAQKLAGTFHLTQEVKAEIAKETANAQAPEQPAVPAQPVEKDTVAEIVQQLPELHDAIGELAEKLKDHVNSWEVFASTEEPAPVPAQPAEPKELPAELPPVDNSLLNSVKGSTAEKLGSEMSDLVEKLKPLFPAPATEEEPKAPEAEKTPVDPQPVPAPAEDNSEPVVTQPAEDNTAPVVDGDSKEEGEQPVVDGENNQAQPDVPVVDGTDNSEVEQPVVDGGDKAEGEQPVVDGENNQIQPDVPVVDGTDNSEVEQPVVDGGDKAEGEQPVVDGENNQAQPDVPVVDGTDNSEVEQPVVDGGDKAEGEQPVVDGENDQAQPEVPVVDGSDDTEVEQPAVGGDDETDPVVPAEPVVPAVEPEEPKAEDTQPSDAAEPEEQPAEQPEAQLEATQPAQPEATETPELQAGNQGSTNSPEAVTPSNTQPVGPVAAPATTPTVELRSNAAGEVVAVFSNNERFERDNLREFAEVAPVETAAAPVARASAVRLSSTGISYSCQVATDKFIKQYNVNPQDMLQLSALGSLEQKYRVATEDFAVFISACANATADKWATFIQNNYINKK